jgi:uncharacterized membrane protein YkoI
MAYRLHHKKTADKRRKAAANKQGKVNVMKTKLFLGFSLATLVLSGSVLAAPKPKVTMDQAQAIALKRVGGGEIIQADTIEKHHNTIYSFFIKENGDVTAHLLVNDKGKIKRFVDETPETAKVK